eukprot:7223628-Alexandrium_andersonii.AAC.1
MTTDTLHIPNTGHALKQHLLRLPASLMSLMPRTMTTCRTPNGHTVARLRDATTNRRRRPLT